MGNIFAHIAQHGLWRRFSNKLKGTLSRAEPLQPPRTPRWLWSDLPEDLLILIFERITDFSDLQSCQAACRCWRSAGKALFWRKPFVLNVVHQQLFTFAATNDATNATNAPIVTGKLDLWQNMTFQRCETTRTTYRGWLLCVFDQKNSLNFSLHNPITGVTINLPPVTEFISKFITSTSPTDPNCIIYVLCGFNYDLIGFCKPGDASFEFITLPLFLGIKDIVFYKGELHVLDKFGSLYAFKHDRKQLQEVVERLETSDSAAKEMWFKYNMVKESRTGDLVLVQRVVSVQSTPQQPNNLIAKTESFKIFKLKKQYGDGSSVVIVWEQIKNYCTGDDQVLLLATGDSMLVSTFGQDFYKPNCIYFFDPSSKTSFLDNLRMIDLENNTIVLQPFNFRSPSFQLNAISDDSYRWFRASNM